MKSLALAISAMGLVLATSDANAALAPNYQRAKELTAIIDAVAAELPGHPITKIIYQKPDQYQVIAGPCSISASLITIPMKSGMVGARQFEVKLSPPRCRK